MILGIEYDYYDDIPKLYYYYIVMIIVQYYQ